MIAEFQAVVTTEKGNFQVLTLAAKNEEEVRTTLLPNVTIVSLKEVRPVMDWNAATFDRESAAVFLQCSPSKVDALMADGDLPKAKNGRPLFTRAMLERVIEKRMVMGGKAA